MRFLVIGSPMPHTEIDNYNPFTAPSYFDYDALYVDPASVTNVAAGLLQEGTAFEAHDGRPVVNAATTASAVSAGELLRRRLDETQRFLEAGGLVIVGARPNAMQSGIVGFEGCDRYSWLPAPMGMAWGPPYLRAAEGKTLRIVAEDHPMASFLRDFRSSLAYRAVFDDRQAAIREHGRVLAAGGADAPIAMELRVLAGRVVFLPPFSDDLSLNRSNLAERLVDAVRGMLTQSAPSEAPYWERSVSVPGLEQVEAELEETEQAVMDSTARLAVVRERHDALAAHRRLVTADGRALAEAVRNALEVLGFGRLAAEEAGLTVESEGQVAFVECEGSREAVVEWPYVRLQRRLEKQLLEKGVTARGMVVANGQRTRTPEERESQFTDALRIACENYRYSLITGETLFAMVRRALAGATEAELTGMRRRLLSTNGLLETGAALGDVEGKKEEGPIF